MISNLIDEIDNYVKTISDNTNLPASAVIVKQHAIAFSQTYKPQLQRDIATIQDFVKQYNAVKPQLDSSLSTWKTGEMIAQAMILDILNKLSTILKDAIQTNYKAYIDISDYRNSILTDQQKLNGEVNKLTSQLELLESNLKSRDAELRMIIERHRMLVGILGPLGWVSEELANLIVRQKTVEQDINNLAQESNSLSNQMFQTNYVLQIMRQISSGMNTLENSLQNLVNSLTFTDKNMEQAIQSLQLANGINVEIVVEAYLKTLAQQVTLFSVS